MQNQILRDNRPEATDGLFDTSTTALLARFSDKTVNAMRKQEHAAGFARMAASFAFIARPDLREVNQ